MEVKVSYRLVYEVDRERPLMMVSDSEVSWSKRPIVEQYTVEVGTEGIAWPAEAAGELGVLTVRGEDVRRLRVCPTTEVRLLSCEARLDCDVAGADAIYLNGYNSWTDSWERPVDARMTGLKQVPRPVVNKYVIDGSGDYRFTPQDIRRGHQHGFGYGYLRYGEDVMLVGSLDESNGFTTIWESLDEGCLRLVKELPQGSLAAGQELELLAFAICEGKLEEAVACWCNAADLVPRPAHALVGYSSWYRHYQDITHDKLAADFEAVHHLLDGRDLDPCVPVFQIDDGYTNIGDWMTPNPEDFPEGLGCFAQRCEEWGLLPGLWMAPFVCETDSELYRTHPDWLLRDASGAPVVAGTNWSGYYPLDTRLPEVREYVRASLWTATHEWGFRLLKLDFLFAACMVPHDGLNRGQLMADAIDLLRDSVPEGVVFDMCGVPLVSAFGRTEYCRIGCDVGLTWDDVPYMRLLHRERVSTKRSLGCTRGRAHLDGFVFRNDPDVFFLRRDVKLSSRQRSKLIGADAALGGMFLTSDDVAAWDDAQLLAYDRALTVFVDKERGEGIIA